MHDRVYACCAPDLLWGGGGLALIQAVEQIKSSHSDLEAEGRQEEGAGRVQNQTTERSLLTLHSAAAQQQNPFLNSSHALNITEENTEASSRHEQILFS